MTDQPIRVLFVCMGNICRSPAGEGILRHMIEKKSLQSIEVASCGIGDWHLGHAPDLRMQAAAKARGIVLNSKARQFRYEFFDQYDYILVSDKEVRKDLYAFAKTPGHKAKILMMTEFSSNYQGEEVPDPYLQAQGAFDLVLDILEDSCSGILDHIKRSQKS
jgi:protein-tyrosine phosphatase